MAIDAMTASGVAHSGMVAKLVRVPRAFARGVADVVDRRWRARRSDFARRAGNERVRRKPARERNELEETHDDDDGDRCNVMALETEHVLQVYRRTPVVFERGRAATCSTPRRPRYLDLISGHRRRALGHAHPRLAARSPSRRRRCCTRRTCSSIRCRESSRRGSRAVGPAARVLLQQRHGGGRGVPQVRAPLLARAGRRRAPGSSRSSTRSTAARWARCR